MSQTPDHQQQPQRFASAYHSLSDTLRERLANSWTEREAVPTVELPNPVVATAVSPAVLPSPVEEQPVNLGLNPPSDNRFHLTPNSRFLNGLDRDLSAGLEGLLPSPVFRYRVMKQRLEQQIVALEQHIHQCRQVLGGTPSGRGGPPSLLADLEKRLRLMKAHEAMVNRQLRFLLGQRAPWLKGVFWLEDQRQRLGQRLSQLGWGKTPVGLLHPVRWVSQRDPQRAHMAKVADQLAVLNAVLQAPSGEQQIGYRMHGGSAVGETALLQARYEAAAAELERLQNGLPQTPRWHGALDRWLKGVYSAWFKAPIGS